MGRLDKLRWVVCAAPPVTFIIFEETPGFSALEGINAAALFAMSPVVLLMGFLLTALLFALLGWLARKAHVRSRLGFALLALASIGLLNVVLCEGDWLLWIAIELASGPAALLLGPREAPEAQEDVFS